MELKEYFKVLAVICLLHFDSNLVKGNEKKEELEMKVNTCCTRKEANKQTIHADSTSFASEMTINYRQAKQKSDKKSFPR